jgi:hypothetical protein
MQWFFAYSGNAAAWYDEMIRVAVISAQENTSLEAHCIYDAESSHLTNWLQSRGVRMHRAKVPFRDELFSDSVIQANAGTGYLPANASGHYLRLLVPQFARDEVVLYTDCDVMFLNEPELPPCAMIGAVNELDGTARPLATTFNSGVLGINVSAFDREREAFIQHCRDRHFFNREPHSYDQVFLNQYFSTRWTTLPPKMNWRPWQGIAFRPPPIVHFHGPKPTRIREILAGNAYSEERGMEHYVRTGIDAYPHYIGLFEAFLSRQHNSA